jgi:hypothetical protein
MKSTQQQPERRRGKNESAATQKKGLEIIAKIMSWDLI